MVAEDLLCLPKHLTTNVLSSHFVAVVHIPRHSTWPTPLLAKSPILAEQSLPDGQSLESAPLR